MAKRVKRLIVVRFRASRDMWEVDYRDVRGMRHRPLYRSEAEALEEAATRRKDLEQGLPLLDDPDLTVRGYAERWLTCATQELEAKTRESYRQLLDGHVLPILGHVKLRELHRRHIKALVATKRAERLPRKEPKDGRPSDTVAVSSSKAGYSKNTVRLIRAALSTVLSDAVDDGYLATNPAFGAGRKRGKKAEALTQAERLQKIRPLSWKDRDALLSEAASDRRHSVLFATLVKAGLRPGEGFALKPMDIDFKNQTLRVERAATDDGQVKDTKTHEARTVDLTPDLTGTLKRHLTWLRAEALRNGSGEPEWLFPRADGTLMNKDYAAGVFRRILRRAGLPHYRVYDLRHTFASLLLAESAPITYVSAQLGHSSPATTMRFYARWIPSQGKRWVNVLDRTPRAKAQPAGESLEPESGTSGGRV
jgi:integrase